MSDIEDIDDVRRESLDDASSTAMIKKKLEDEFATPMKPTSSKENLHIDPSQDHMKVYLRVRPCTEGEKNKGEDQGCVSIESENCMLTNAPKDSHTYKNSVHGCGKQHHKFTFSRIFNEDTSQKAFFDATMLTTVKEFVDGQNCLVFTYGVTNSGKTYTIQGMQRDGGILPRALDVVFNSISERQLETCALKPNMFCDVTRLTPSQEQQERKNKENVFKMATGEEQDMTTLLDDADATASTINSTMSEDSIMHRQSIASNASSKTSLDQASIQQLFEESQDRIKEDASINVENQGQIRFSVWVSFLEIYNELIHDLLIPIPKKKNARRQVLQLREDRNGVPYVRGLKEVSVTSADEAYKVLTIGQQNLQMACTKLNQNSSRSHCIFTIKMIRVVDKERPNMARISMLSLCDLAGSERYTKTQSFGDRMKEAGNINTSLLTLGRCIKILRHNQQYKDNMKIVPFRESKLTRLFQSFFCGKGRASMIVNINQNASTFDETLHALKYSAVAKQVVVIQEPEKPKKYMPTKVSLALSQTQRQTIGWATPGTMRQLIAQQEVAIDLPLPDDDSEFEDESQDTEEESNDKHAVLLSVIENLKQQLIEQKRQQLSMEARIRDEVCQEMSNQLVEIENNYSELLKRNHAMAEEKFDKRLEIYAQSVKKSRKRQRMFPDPNEEEDEEYVPSIQLHQEKVKVEEKEKEIEELRSKQSSFEKDLIKLKASLEVEIEARKEAETRGQVLAAELSDAQTKLEEASTLASSVEELQHLVEESERQLHLTEDRLRNKDETIRKLQRLVDSPSSERCGDCQQHIIELAGALEKLADAEAELDQQSEQLSKMQQMSDFVNSNLMEKEDIIVGLEKQLNMAKDDASKSAQNMTSKSDHLETSNEALNTANANVERLENEVKTLNSSITKITDEHVSQIKQLEKDIREKDIELTSSTKAENDIKNTLKQVKEGFESAEQRLDKEEMEHQEVVKQLNEQIADITKGTKGLEDMTQKVIELEAESRSSEAKVSELENALKGANKELRNETTKYQQLHGELEEKNSEYKSVKIDFKESQKQLEEYILKVNEQAEQLGDTEDKLKEEKENVKSLKEEIVEGETNIQKLQEKVRLLEDKCRTMDKDFQEEKKKAMKVAQVKSRRSIETSRNTLDQMEKILNEKNNKLDQLQNDLKQAKDEAGDLKLAVGKTKDTVVNLEQQVSSLENDKKAMEARIITVMQEVQEAEKEIANNKKIDKEKSSNLDEMTRKLEEMQNKVDELQSSVQMAEEADSKLQECQATLDKVCKESERQQERIGELEAGQNSENGADEEELEKMRYKIQDLQNQVDDESYKHQMAVRQIRKEKNQVEKLLKESEQNIEELKQELNKLKQRLAEEENFHALTTEKGSSDASEHKKELTNLEEALRDLETCLRSSKQSEVRIQEQANSYKEKVKALENELEEKERTIQDLEDTIMDAKNESICLVERGVEADRARLDLSDAKESIRELETQLESLRMAKANQEVETEKARQKLLKLKDQVSKDQELRECKMEEIKARHNQERAELREKLADAEQERDEACEERQSLGRRMETLANNLAIAQDDAEQMLEELEQSNKTLEQMKSAKEGILKDKEDLLCKLASTESHCENLESEKAEMKCHLDSEIQKAENALQELEDHHAKAKSIEQKDDENKETVAAKDNAIRSLEDKIVELEEDLDAKEQQYSAAVDALRDFSDEVRDQFSQMRQESEEFNIEYECMATDSTDLLKIIKDKNVWVSQTLIQCYQQLQLKVTELKSCKVEIEQRTEELEKEKSQSEDHLSQVKEKEEHIATLSERLAAKDATETELRTQAEEHSKFSEQLNEKKELLNKLRDENSKLLSQITELRSFIGTLKDKCQVADKVETCLKEKEVEVEEKDKELKVYVEKCDTFKQDLSNKLVDVARLQEKCSKLEAKLSESANVRVELERQRSSAPSKAMVTTLEDQVKEFNSKISCLETELRTREASIESYNRQITLSKQEVDLLNEQIQKSEERESNLRKQMHASSKDLEQRNLTITQLEDKLRASTNSNNKLEKQVLDLMATIDKLKAELELTKEDLGHQEDKVKRLERDQERNASSVDYELKDLKKELAKKDTRLKQRTKTVEELMDKIDTERKSFEIALKDSKSNELLIATLKAALEEQDESLDKQDKVIQNREDEIKGIHTELKESAEKYTSCLKSSQEASNQLRQVEKGLQTVKCERQAAEVEIERLRGQVHEAKVDADRIKVDFSRMQQCTSETKNLETKYETSRAEIEQLREALDSMKKKHTSAEQEVDKLRQQLERTHFQVQASVEAQGKLKKELDKAQHQLPDSTTEVTELKVELKEIKKTNNKTTKDKLRLEEEVRENVKDLQSLEKRLTEIVKENGHLKNEIESMKSELKQSKQDDKSAAPAILLKRKFEALEEDKKELEREVLKYKEHMANVEAKKDKELTKWREERDKLVGGLEAILKEKDSEIKFLKSSGTRTKHNSGDTKGNQALIEELTAIKKQLKHDFAEMECLRKQVQEKDAIIADLSRHLEDAPTPRSTRFRNARSHADTPQEELDNLRKELERERQQGGEKLHNAMRAKDAVIEDLKDQNMQLQSHIPYQLQVKIKSPPPTPAQSENYIYESHASTSTTPGSPVVHVPIKQTGRRATRGGKAGRQPRKRKSEEEQQNESLNDSTASRPTRGRGRPRRSSKRSTGRDDENSEPAGTITPGSLSMGVIREEDVVDLSMMTSPARTAPLNPNIGHNVLDCDTPNNMSTPHTDRISTFVSPSRSASAHKHLPPSSRKKRRLKNTDDSPFSTTPTDPPMPAVQPTPDAHAIVTRKLRSRRR